MTTPPDTFTAIDVELDARDDASLCAAGVVRVTRGRPETATVHHFRPPTVTGYWSKLHGIAVDRTRRARALADGFPPLLAQLREAPVLVAYNAAFERRVFGAVSRTLGLRATRLDIRCALAWARRALKLHRYRLQDVCRHLFIPHTPHDPASDAQATASLVLALRTRLIRAESEAGRAR